MMQTVGAQGYYTTPAPSASAVNIQIFEPKAYAAPQTQMPYAVQNPMYAYPQASMYTQPYMNQYQQFMPQPYAIPAQMSMTPQAAPQVQQQPMPAPVLDQPQAAAPQALPQQQETTPQAAPQAQAPAETQAPQAQNAIDVNSLVAALQNPDAKVQEDAITKIANLSQGEPDMQNAVLSEPVMKGLADIIKQDTSNLQGPTQAQNDAINKAAAGQQLTPEEQALVDQLAPKTAADRNRIIAMFTLAMLQKNQRDEIERYNQTQDPANQLPQLKINDLIGYNEIENAARNESEKEVKLAAIQALSYVAKPEDRQTIEAVFQSALNDSEPLIQSAASEAIANLGGQQAAAAADGQQPTEAQQPDLSKMSRKERKAYEKEMKKAEKAAKKAEKEAAKKAA